MAFIWGHLKEEEKEKSSRENCILEPRVLGQVLWLVKPTKDGSGPPIPAFFPRGRNFPSGRGLWLQPRLLSSNLGCCLLPILDYRVFA